MTVAIRTEGTPTIKSHVSHYCHLERIIVALCTLNDTLLGIEIFDHSMSSHSFQPDPEIEYSIVQIILIPFERECISDIVSTLFPISIEDTVRAGLVVFCFICRKPLPIFHRLNMIHRTLDHRVDHGVPSI